MMQFEGIEDKEAIMRFAEWSEVKRRGSITICDVFVRYVNNEKRPGPAFVGHRLQAYVHLRLFPE
jgi:hypothetical protein